MLLNSDVLINIPSTLYSGAESRTNFDELFWKQGRNHVEGEARDQENVADRISALPDSLILLILSFLSMKDVVKTSILSKRWQFLWTSIDTLTFICEDNPNSVRFQKFIEFVNRTLDLHDFSRVRKFSLHCKAAGITDICDTWIRFATDNNVEDLELDLQNPFAPDVRKFYQMPIHLYTNLSLKYLKLKYCCIDYSRSISWPCLKTLVLERIYQFSDRTIEKVLSGCPALQVLVLQKLLGPLYVKINSQSLKTLKLDCDIWVSSLQIEAPYLEELEISGKIADLPFRLVNANSLVQLKLNMCLYVMHYQKLMELLSSVRHVVKLILNFEICKPLPSLSSSGNDIHSGAFKCKVLMLHSSITKFGACAILTLLQNAPDLETLILNMDKYRRMDIGKEACLSNQKRIEFLSHLRTVKIIAEDFDSFEKLSAVELVEFLLKYGQSLETVTFELKAKSKSFSSSHMSEKSHILSQKLSNSPHASSRAKIRFSVQFE